MVWRIALVRLVQLGVLCAPLTTVAGSGTVFPSQPKRSNIRALDGRLGQSSGGMINGVPVARATIGCQAQGLNGGGVHALSHDRT